jgi:hypothetical protein
MGILRKVVVDGRIAFPGRGNQNSIIQNSKIQDSRTKNQDSRTRIGIVNRESEGKIFEFF